MIGGKELLTYKRKRPLPRDDISQGNGYPESSAEGATNKVPNISDKHEELDEGNKSENVGEDSERSPKGKRLCSSVKQQDFLVSALESTRVEEKNNSTEHVKQVMADLYVDPESPPSEGRGEKASQNQLFTSLDSEGKSCSTQEGSCSSVNHSSACGDKSTENYSALASVNLNAVGEPNLVNVKSSIKGNHSDEYTAANSLEERSGSLVEDNSSSMHINNVRSKLTSKLITFRRRSKQKKDDAAVEAQNTLPAGVNCSVPLEGCKSAASVNAHEATSPKHCSLQASENLSPSKKNFSCGRSFIPCQEEINSRDVNNSCVCTSSMPEIGSFNQAEEQLGNTSKDNSSSVEEVLPQDSGSSQSTLQTKISGDFGETPVGTGNSLHDTKNDPSHEAVLPTCNESMGKSQSLSNCDLNATKMTDDNLCNRKVRPTLDLSVPPADSPVLVDCNVALEPDPEEQPVRSLPETETGNPTAVFSEVSQIDKGMESLKEKIRGKQPFHSSQELENGSSTQETIGAKHNYLAKSSPVLALKDNCLQLFPEGRSDDQSWEKTTAGADSGGRTLSLLPGMGYGRTAEAKTSHCFPMSLPMEPMLDSHACSSTIPQLPYFGTQSRGFSQERMPQYSGNQASSFLRDKMMLDGVARANRARATRGNRSSFFDRFDSATTWSEDELDCLWIGVRRYGRGNWDAMMRDPRLHFFPYRTSRDLAEQWEVEQSKLYSSAPCPSTRPPGRPNSSPDSMGGFRHPKTGTQNSVNDVQLSLGNAHSQRRCNFQKRPLVSYMNAQSNIPIQLQNHIANTRTMHPSNGIPRTAMFESHSVSDVEPPVSSNPPTATDGNLPHWLKEVVAVPPRPPPNTTLPAGAAAVHCGDMQWITQPSLDPNGNRPESRKRVGVTHRLPDSNELLQSCVRTQRNSHQPVPGPENADPQESNVPRQVIIINSDGSSEETISDDLTIRP